MDTGKLKAMDWIICRDHDGHLVLAQLMGFSVSDTDEHFVCVAEDDGERYSIPQRDILRTVKIFPGDK